MRGGEIMKHNTVGRLVRLFAVLLVLGVAFSSTSAWAMSLDEAKSAGYVGETQQGYLGVVKSAPGVEQLVNQINLERRQHYREIARKNGTSLNAVEAIVGQKLIGRAGPGEYVQGPSGWVKK